MLCLDEMKGYSELSPRSALKAFVDINTSAMLITRSPPLGRCVTQRHSINQAGEST